MGYRFALGFQGRFRARPETEKECPFLTLSEGVEESLLFRVKEVPKNVSGVRVMLNPLDINTQTAAPGDGY